MTDTVIITTRLAANGLPEGEDRLHLTNETPINEVTFAITRLVQAMKLKGQAFHMRVAG